MSDSVKKWHEMQEEKEFTKKVKALEKSNTSATSAGTFIYESPDGGKTVTKRPFGGDIEEREAVNFMKGDTLLTSREKSEIKKQAYTILVNNSEEAVRMAYKILNAV